MIRAAQSAGLSMPYAMHETIGTLNDMIALHNAEIREREKERGKPDGDEQ